MKDPSKVRVYYTNSLLVVNQEEPIINPLHYWDPSNEKCMDMYGHVGTCRDMYGHVGTCREM